MSHPIDIPDEVKQAHLAGNLVLFCGAGISQYTDLPGFRGLVRDVIEDCGLPLSKNKKSAKKAYERAFHNSQFDKSLGLLVNKEEIPSEVMRRYIRDRLTGELPPRLLKSGPFVHKAILSLAKQQSGGYYLVTTNFDDRFELANIDKDWVHDAPRLAPPRKGEWKHATFLHGRIGPHDPNNLHLVLTGEDFGNAYMRDAWAARFVVELFREFTILFIGYSVDDPVMSYLVDAMAADNRFNRAYALAGYKSKNSDRLHQQEEWDAKGIELIPFDTGPKGKNYKVLYSTLQSWAQISANPFETRLEEIIGATKRPYLGSLPPHELRHLAWCLSDVKVAAAFSDAAWKGKYDENEPAGPHISWLKPLSEIELYLDGKMQPPVRLFDMPAQLKTNKHNSEIPVSAPLAGHTDFIQLSKITRELMKWVVLNLDSLAVVDWVIIQGGSVHDDFSFHIKDKLKELPEPYKEFWTLVVSNTLITKGEIL